MIVFLQKAVFSFNSFVGDNFRIVPNFTSPLIFSKIMKTFDFLSFFLHSKRKKGEELTNCKGCKQSSVEINCGKISCCSSR